MKHVKLVVCLAGNLNYSIVRYHLIVFPLISTPGAYFCIPGAPGALRGATVIRREVSMWIQKDAVLLRGRRILEEIVYTIVTV